MSTCWEPRPGDIDPDEFRRAGEHALAAIAEYHAGLDARAVLPQVTPPQVAALFSSALPEKSWHQPRRRRPPSRGE